MKDFILEVRKIIPSNVCKKIISYYNEESMSSAKIVSGEDKTIRNCQIKHIQHPDSFGKKLINNYINKVVWTICDEYIKKHGHFNYSKITQLDFLKYEKNNFDTGYKYHVDFGETCSQRHLSISINLNNDFTGGEFVFDLKEGQVQYPQNEGDAIAFPSNFMFPHQVNSIKSGTRYALIAWVI